MTMELVDANRYLFRIFQRQPFQNLQRNIFVWNIVLSGNGA